MQIADIVEYPLEDLGRKIEDSLFAFAQSQKGFPEHVVEVVFDIENQTTEDMPFVLSYLLPDRSGYVTHDIGMLRAEDGTLLLSSSGPGVYNNKNDFVEPLTKSSALDRDLALFAKRVHDSIMSEIQVIAESQGHFVDPDLWHEDIVSLCPEDPMLDLPMPEMPRQRTSIIEASKHSVSTNHGIGR